MKLQATRPSGDATNGRWAIRRRRSGAPDGRVHSCLSTEPDESAFRSTAPLLRCGHARARRCGRLPHSRPSMISPRAGLSARLVFLASVAILSPGSTLTCVPHATARETKNTVYSDVLDGDFPDPFVLRQREVYYAYATGVGGVHVQVAISQDLAAWKRGADALPQLPKWAARGDAFTWAPSVLARGDRYVLYYTTRESASGFQCISRAISRRPEGPYDDASSQPFICQIDTEFPLCGSIDPSPFLDADGKAYLFWKSDENSPRCRTIPRIWAQRLSDDGVELIGSATAVLTMDQTWEAPLIEAPSMFLYGGRYWLFYSASHYESADYAIGYATCPGPMSPCTKAITGAPWLQSHGSVLGPGGQEVFTDANGAAWMAYHAWTAPKTTYGLGGARSLRLGRVAFASEPRLEIISGR
jgi:beta-xylosidase